MLMVVLVVVTSVRWMQECDCVTLSVLNQLFCDRMAKQRPVHEVQHVVEVKEGEMNG